MLRGRAPGRRREGPLHPGGRAHGDRRGIKRVSDRFDETFVVIMGDTLTDIDIREVISFHEEKGAIATLALTRVADTSEYGVVELDADATS